jgi:hypothetical protein
MRPAIPNGNYCFYTRDVVCSGHEPDHFRKDLHPGKTGTLRPGPEPGTVEATITDTMGFTIVITGTRDGDTYQLTGVPGRVPDAFRIDGVDE